MHVLSESAPVALAHRLVGARTQSRVEVSPGCTLLRGARARNEWTMAIPPLLQQHARDVKERRVAFLVEATHAAAADEDAATLTFEVHRARSD